MYFDLVRLYGKPYNLDKTAFGVSLVLEPLDAAAQPTRASSRGSVHADPQGPTDAAPLLSKNRSMVTINYYANQAIEARYSSLNGQPYSGSCSCRGDHYEQTSTRCTLTPTGLVHGPHRFGAESIFELCQSIRPEADLTTGSLDIISCAWARLQGHPDGSWRATTGYAHVC